MIKKFNKIYVNQLFRPIYFSVFINPFYFYRKGLYNTISSLAYNLSGKLLDFGCGLKPYKNLFINSSEYIGIDIENTGHDHSNEDVDIFYDGKNIPFEKNSFDSVFCSEVLEHVPDLEMSMGEIKRVLKPGGNLLITVPFFWMEHEKPNDYRRFTKDGIIQVLKINNFEIVHVKTVSHFSEAMFQMWSMYIYSFFGERNKYLRMILSFIFISPITISGLIVTFLLPKISSLYLGTVILVRNNNE